MGGVTDLAKFGRGVGYGSRDPNWQRSGIELVRIPAGKFSSGDDKEPVYLDEFWIARTPVTNRQYQMFVAETGHEPPSDWEGKRVHPVKLNHPVVNVSWHDAQAFCEWAGVFLPTEEQWEKAARGTDGRTYPWGNQAPDPQLCNYGTNEGDTTPVGRYSPHGDSPYGLVDMAGNVWEWCEDWVRKGETRALRGGAWFDKENDVRCANRDWFYSDLGCRNVSFRVVTP